MAINLITSIPNLFKGGLYPFVLLPTLSLILNTSFHDLDVYFLEVFIDCNHISFAFLFYCTKQAKLFQFILRGCGQRLKLKCFKCQKWLEHSKIVPLDIWCFLKLFIFYYLCTVTGFVWYNMPLINPCCILFAVYQSVFNCPFLQNFVQKSW